MAAAMMHERHGHARAHPRQRIGGLRRPAWLAASAAMTSRVTAVLAIAALVSTAAAQTSEAVFDLRIANGSVALNMRLLRVRQGDAVKMRWTTDRPIILHLHGYDIEMKVEPGKVTEMAFTARATGRFPIEEHKSDARGGHSHGEAPLVRIEVYPR
jgi:hypothetical protein